MTDRALNTTTPGTAFFALISEVTLYTRLVLSKTASLKILWWTK